MEPFVQKMLFRQTFVIDVYEGVTGAGDKVFNPQPITVKGYYVGSTRIILNNTGQQVLSNGHFFVKAEDYEKITVGSLTTLPMESGKFPILHCEPFFKENGILAFGVVYLK